MRRINGSESRSQVQVHLDRNDAPVFEESHRYRVQVAREYLGKAVAAAGEQALIIDLGCGSGDISGPFSARQAVVGIDCVPAAMSTLERFPDLDLIVSPVEKIVPMPCDILVMCEFLEHLDDPWKVVDAWASQARYMVIGHPLDDEDGLEPGHSWSYTMEDFRTWFSKHGFTLQEHVVFGMGPFKSMVCGWGGR